MRYDLLMMLYSLQTLLEKEMYKEAKELVDKLINAAEKEN